MCSCDSYNTVQLQMGRGLVAGENGAPPTQEPSSPTTGSSALGSALPSRLRERSRTERGRVSGSPRRCSRNSGTQVDGHEIGHGQVRRTASLPSVPLVRIESPILADLHAHPAPLAPTQSQRDGGESDATWEAMDTGSEEDDKDEDVNFWGGESPRSGALALRRVMGWDTDMSEDGEVEEDSEAEESTVDYLDESNDDDDDDDDGMGFGNGDIELIGHR